jgi:hypothetical protein
MECWSSEAKGPEVVAIRSQDEFEKIMTFNTNRGTRCKSRY